MASTRAYPARPGPASEMSSSPFPLHFNNHLRISFSSHTMPRPPIAALLIDLSGTLHIGSDPISGAQRAVQRLRAACVPFRFCSNTSKEGRRELRARLTAMGFDVHGSIMDGTHVGRRKEEEELWTSLGAVGEAARELGLRRCVRTAVSSRFTL